MKTIVFGIGTGRCGTQTLAALLNEQDGANYFSHEYGRTWTRWGSDVNFMYRIICNLSSRPGDFAGDVSFYHLHNITPILSLKDRDIIRNIQFKVVCLKRPKELVVRSFMKATKSDRGEFNHWTSRTSDYWINGNYDEYGQWDPMYPKYNLPKQEAIERYYDDYYVVAERLANYFPDEFRIFDTIPTLNDEESQKEMLLFAGFNPNSLHIKTDIKKNVQFT